MLPDDRLTPIQVRSQFGWPIVLGSLALIVQKTIWTTNPDTSWLITVTERMNSGDRLYTDIIELNPPGSIWLYWLPVKLAHLLALSPEAIVDAYTFLICLASVAMTGWIIHAGKLMADRALPPAMALMLFCAIALVGNSFSERDHIGVVLLIPLIALAAWRSTGSIRPEPRHWLVAGAAGGAIAMVKPYYALIVIAVAGFVVVRKRDSRLFFLPEFLLAGTVTVGYLVVAYIIYPDFYEKLLPLLRETYMAFSQPFGLLATLLLPLLVLPLAYSLFARRGGRSTLSDLLMISAGVALIPFFVQGKGWPYHAYPAAYLGSAAVIVAACKLIFQPSSPDKRLLAVGGIAGLLVIALLVAHFRFFPDPAPSRSFVASVRAETASSTVGLLGGDLAAGHPLTRMMRGHWIEPYCSDWIATYAVRLKNDALRRGDAAGAAYFQAMMNRYLEEKLDRLERSPPQILIVDRGDGLVTEMLAEHGFSNLLADYTKLASYDRPGYDDPLEVYRLTSGNGATPAM
ncbi:hypothetical protein CYK37_26720 [Mesorhizobium loti]|nr:hypothetical protein CYK37_26720 [Mesorhizobium loti]